MNEDDPKPLFTVVCAWCGQKDERTEAPPAQTNGAPAVASNVARPITHVICDTCFARERAENERIVRGRRRQTG